MIIIIIVLSAFLLGYVVGRYNGRKQGFEEGKTIAPLILREQSFEQGYCILCNKVTSIHDIGKINGEE